MSPPKARNNPEKLRTILSAGGELRLAVSGGSMRPFLREGDYLVIRPLEGEPRIGEVIVYFRAGQLWAHRLLARGPSGKYLITKGDARGRPDARVDPRQLIGRAVAVERGGRRSDLEGLGSRLAGLAVSLAAPAAVLGKRLARSTGLTGSRASRRIAVAGFTVEISGPPAALKALPGDLETGSSEADFRVEIQLRNTSTTGGRYGLSSTGGDRYTFSAPSVMARVDMSSNHCRCSLLPPQESTGLRLVLRILLILLTTGRGKGLALHASAAEHHGSAVLFSGPGGAGKSTALCSVVDSGARPIADDLVLLRKFSGGWRAWGPPVEPGLSGRRYCPGEGVPVGYLVIPVIGSSRLRLREISPARWATLAAVFPPGAPLFEVMLDRLADLARSVPAFSAEYADRPGALLRIVNMLEQGR